MTTSSRASVLIYRYYHDCGILLSLTVFDEFYAAGSNVIQSKQPMK